MVGNKFAALGESFANYLLSAKRVRDSIHYKSGSVLQIYMQWFTQLAKRPDLRNVTQYAKENCYSDMFKFLQRRLHVAEVKRGLAITAKSKCIRRKLLSDIVTHVLKENSSEAYLNRAVLTVLRQAMGRGGEVSTATWDSVSWDSNGEMLVMDWREVKTGKENIINFGPDKDNWKLDVFHSLASYVATYNGEKTVEKDVNWMFPSFFEKFDGGASKKASKIIKDCLGYVSLVIGFPLTNSLLIHMTLP